MTVEEIITYINEKGFEFTQPYRDSMGSSKWVLEVANKNKMNVHSFEGTKEEMYDVYKQIMIGVYGKYEDE